MRQAICDRQSQSQCSVVCETGAGAIRNRSTLFHSETTQLKARPVHEHDAYVQAAEQCDVNEQRWKMLVLDDFTIYRDYNELLAKTRNVSQNFTQIGELDHAPILAFSNNRTIGL